MAEMAPSGLGTSQELGASSWSSMRVAGVWVLGRGWIGSGAVQTSTCAGAAGSGFTGCATV